MKKLSSLLIPALLASCTPALQVMSPKSYEGRVIYKDPHTPLMNIETRVDEFNNIPSPYLNKALYDKVEKDSSLIVYGSEIYEYRIFRKDTLITYIEFRVDTAIHVPEHKLRYKNKRYIPQKQAKHKLFQRIEPEPFFEQDY